MSLVITHNKQVRTTTLLVAEKFGRKHDDVLKSLRNLECSEEFFKQNYSEGTYTGRSGGTHPMYYMTRDGFTLLVMSFSGAAAAKFREEFIEQFNKMEQLLRSGSAPVFLPTYQQRILSEPTKGCPDTHWSIFDESHSIMLWVEKNVGSVNQYDLVDGSIGLKWSKYREGKEWAGKASTYPHQYSDVRGTRDCKCYPFSELPYFRKWLKDVYKPVALYDYLHGKFTREKNHVLLSRVEELKTKLIS